MTGFIEPEGLKAFGHYIAFVKRLNGVCEVHDDLIRSIKTINSTNYNNCVTWHTLVFVKKKKSIQYEN